jgi:hypothetical protein
MGYDFRRSYRQTFTNGVSTELVNNRFVPCTAFSVRNFRPDRPLRVMVTVTGKAENFEANNNNATAGFTGSVGLGTRHNPVCDLSGRRF